MRRRRSAFGLLSALALTIGPAPLLAQVPPPAQDRDEARALAEVIDRRLAEKWEEANVRPGPLADDAEFLRRVSLDLAGRIPSVAETRAFLEDTTPGKRGRLVETLLRSPAYVNHFTNIWRNLLTRQGRNQKG